MARIGFIGLGNMGLPMAQNLIKAGHQVEGVDVNPAAVAKLVAAGGASAEFAKIAAARADVVITMLPAGKQVREVYLGSSGIIENANDGTLLIDCSTIDVETARAVAGAAEKKGLMMLDAPVSGGVGGATAATLTFMVGGSTQAFIRAESILQKMGKTIVQAGGSGTGQAARTQGIPICGKTGTAQVVTMRKGVQPSGERFRDHAWFVAFAPVEKPEIALSVLVEHGGPGGGAAAPIARRAIEGYWRSAHPQPQKTESSQPTEE
jgi:6-phosphogluconate dehydrogenase (decarboxylating)